jgi:hypothetical protein
MYKSIQTNVITLKNEKLKQSTIAQINKSITNCLSMHTNHTGYEHKWYRENEIPEDMKTSYEEYISSHELPEIVVHKSCKKVYKFDKDNVVVKTYSSIVDTCRNENLTEKVLKKSILSKTIIDNYYFSFDK